MKKFLVLLCSFVVSLNSVVFADQINLFVNNKAVHQNDGVAFQLNGEAYCEITNLNCDNFTITVTNTGKKTCTVTAHRKNGATEINGYGDLLALGWDTLAATKLCELKVTSGKTKTWVKNLSFHGKNRVYIKMTKGDSCFVKVSGGLATYGGNTSNQQSNQIQNNNNSTARPTTVVPQQTTTPQRQTTTSVKNGWVWDHGWYCYFDGVKLKNCFAMGADGKTYYLQASGLMYTPNMKNSIKTIKGQKYLFYSNGSIEDRRTWVQMWDGKWVFVTGASGVLAVNTTIDGYKIDKNGYWVQ